jgi:hypothetical protein
MSDPENFLSRWARRKRAAVDESKAPAAIEPTAEEMPAAAADASRVSLPKEETPAFDLDSLPSIDSITADTDIRGFFAPGVPAELTRAALRRAWIADPMVKDFVGLAENAWDFNNPSSIPGFGPLEMTDELRREVERIVGNVLPEEAPSDSGVAAASPPAGSAQPQAPAWQIAAGPEPTLPNKAAITVPVPDDPAGRTDKRLSSEATLRCTQDDAATQQSDRSQEILQSPARRGHGGALPK